MCDCDCDFLLSESESSYVGPLHSKFVRPHDCLNALAHTHCIVPTHTHTPLECGNSSR